jgi:hypothetical protein
MQYVPVVDSQQKPLMPTTPARARRWVRSGKATPFFKKGVFCVRLNQQPSDTQMQPVVVAIDPGSKREGFTVKSELHTYLNIESHAVDWVKDAVTTRRQMRRGRRNRNTPCRQNRCNRSIGRIPPSTKARWGWKLRIAVVLAKIFPVTHFRVEDIKAHCFGGRRWNKSFSPLQVGKKWFYDELRKLGLLRTNTGWETKKLRDAHGLKKSKNKLSEDFSAHCVDSWVMANDEVGGHTKPDNTDVMVIEPIRLHRRQLHRLQFSKGHIRKPYGGTRSEGFSRGSLVRHPKFGLCYVGGATKGRISLHDVSTGKRLTQSAKPEDTKFLSFNTWRVAASSPQLKLGVSAAT